MRKRGDKAVSINGAKLRELLKREGLSQQQLSRDMGYGQQYLSVAAVSGRISKRAINLLKAIGIDPEEYVIPETTESVVQEKLIDADHAISVLQEKLTDDDPAEHVLPERVKDMLQKKLTETAELPAGYNMDYWRNEYENQKAAEKPAVLTWKTKAIIQAELCLSLMYRLDLDIRNGVLTSPSQKQDDIVKIRRELNNLKYILQWEQMGEKYEAN